MFCGGLDHGLSLASLHLGLSPEQFYNRKNYGFRCEQERLRRALWVF